LVFLGSVVLMVRVAQIVESARIRYRNVGVALQLVLGLAIVVPYWIYTPFPRLRDAEYETWPGIKPLAAMKVNRVVHPGGLIVEALRTVSGEGPDNAVLLLPTDPPLEAYLERPKPQLSALLIFMDQYWDRYVDQDFDRLRQAPPKIIVLGPDPVWMRRVAYFRPESDWGTLRLIGRIERELLPERYQEVDRVFWTGSEWSYRVFRRK
jgi:hypothetical protein